MSGRPISSRRIARRAIGRRALLAGMAGLLGAASVPARGRADAPLLMVNGDDHAPYSAFGPDDSPGGLIVEIVDIVARAAGLTVRQALYPWPRAQQMVESGLADCLCTAPTPTRGGAMLWSEPLLRDPMYMFYRADSPQRAVIEAARGIDDMRDLLVSDYLGNGWGESHYAGLRTEQAPSPRLAVRKIALGHGDVVIASMIQIRSILRQDRIDGLTWRQLPGADTLDYCWVIRKSHERANEIIGAVNAVATKPTVIAAISERLARYI